MTLRAASQQSGTQPVSSRARHLATLRRPQTSSIAVIGALAIVVLGYTETPPHAAPNSDAAMPEIVAQTAVEQGVDRLSWLLGENSPAPNTAPTGTPTATPTGPQSPSPTAAASRTQTPTAASTAPRTTSSTSTAPAPRATSSSSSTTTKATTSTSSSGNSGYGVSKSLTLKASAALTITTDGTVIDGLAVHGMIFIMANNVTIRNSSVTAAAYSAVAVKSGYHGVVIDHVTVNGLGFSGVAGSAGVSGASRVTNCDISGVENGVVATGSSYVGANHIHDLAAPGSPHYDGVQMDGGQHDTTIENNLIDLRNWGQTSAVMIDNDFGPVSNVTVRNNRLIGAGYTLYVDGQFSSVDHISGVVVANNRFSGGAFGDIVTRNASTTITGNGNTDSGGPARVTSL